ncbi:MAG: penicillin acylase family protein, partial [Alphaproteobacteria bacterium]
PFVHRHGAGLRAVYDLADLDGSLFALAPGQSGNILSAHYQDTLRGWRDGVFFALGPHDGASLARKTVLLPGPQPAP